MASSWVARLTLMQECDFKVNHATGYNNYNCVAVTVAIICSGTSLRSYYP